MASSRVYGRLSSARRVVHLALAVTLATVGCATPGLPRPPSLNLPEPVRDLSATHIGDTVELRFTTPVRSTDKLPLRGGTLTAIFCREIGHQDCLPLASSRISIPIDSAASPNDAMIWTDTLPSDLCHGAAQLLGYRVQILNAAGHSAGNSAPAFTAAGAAPAPVVGLHAEGSRLGAVLRWSADPSRSGEVTLQREEISTSPASGKPAAMPKSVQMSVPPIGAGAASTSLLDTSAKPEVSYSYTATRHFTVKLGGRAIELRSSPSSAVELTLHQIYAPAAPTGLTAASSFADKTAPPHFAVDLIWQPTDDNGLICPLAGYIVYREALESTGRTSAARTRLNAAPLLIPAFNDTTAVPGARYRYSVTAIDIKGNESLPSTTLLNLPTR